ncbi:MAG TPA: hypothetical protein VHR45_24710 [Thermoanaerobaculia bacterium]|nr:hypothetical protein [Thermoanaerobaculia bacterium]
MTLTRIRRVRVLSLAAVTGCTYAVFGLIGGGIFALFALFGAALGNAFSPQHSNPVFGVLFGVGAVIFFPIFYGIIGFIGGLISGAIYNLVASMAGGIELELETIPGAG